MMHMSPGKLAWCHSMDCAVHCTGTGHGYRSKLLPIADRPAHVLDKTPARRARQPGGVTGFVPRQRPNNDVVQFRAHIIVAKKPLDVDLLLQRMRGRQRKLIGDRRLHFAIQKEFEAMDPARWALPAQTAHQTFPIRRDRNFGKLFGHRPRRMSRPVTLSSAEKLLLPARAPVILPG